MSTITPTQSVEVVEAPAHNMSWYVNNVVLRFAMVWLLIILAFVSNAMYPGFFARGNLENILYQNASVGVVAVGMTFVMIAGGFDLSVGAIYALAAVVFATLSNSHSMTVAFALTLLVGLTAGTINGAIVTKLNVNPFVATLGTASLFGGAAYIYSESAPVISQNENFRRFGNDRLVGLPVIVWVLIIIILVGGLLLSRTVYGRSVYAVGGNNEAARLAGIRVHMVRGSTFSLVGVLAALGGMMLASRVGVGQGDFGATIPLDAIAIVIVGGTSLLGGEGAMWRTVVGLCLLGTINNLFDSLGWTAPAQEIVKGTILIVAVSIDVMARKRA
jgi:ribose transport system permease protein